MNHENEQDEGHEQDDAENQNSSNSSGSSSAKVADLLEQLALSEERQQVQQAFFDNMQRAQQAQIEHLHLSLQVFQGQANLLFAHSTRQFEEQRKERIEWQKERSEWQKERSEWRKRDRNMKFFIVCLLFALLAFVMQSRAAPTTTELKTQHQFTSSTLTTTDTELVVVSPSAPPQPQPLNDEDNECYDSVSSTLSDRSSSIDIDRREYKMQKTNALASLPSATTTQTTI